MARTRNLDPGRVPALHYAFTRWRRHAKRLVYAYFVLVGLSPEPILAAPGATSPAARQTGVPCAACQILSLTPGQEADLPVRLEGARLLLRLNAGAPEAEWAGALARLRARGARVGLHVIGVPADGDAMLSQAGELLVIEPGPAEPDQLAFDLKKVLAAARGRSTGAALMLATTPEQAAALQERGLTPYADGFIPRATPIAKPGELADSRPASPVSIRVLPEAAPDAAGIASAAIVLQRWLPEGLVPVPDRALSCGGDRRLPTYLNPQTLDLAAVTDACPPPAAVASDVAGAAVERVDLGSRTVFLVRAGQGDRFAAGVDVAAARTLTVEEIIARHQAAAMRQATAIETLISSGTMTLTFEAPGFVAPVTVSSETTIFQEPGRGGPVDIRQANIRVNGVSFNAAGGVPRLPIIEPERAASPPLAITLSDLYSYRLAGRETVRGRDAYVVAFSPRSSGESLYKGRAWIDAATFGMIRVAAAQTALRGAITVSEQADDFALDADGRWLLARSDVRQTYEGASVRTPIHRLLVIERHVVDAPDYDAQRGVALASADVMLRETPEGYRYLAKEAPSRSAAGTLKSDDARRVVAGRSDRIRTFAFGAIIDPNISRPLPFAGLSYVDFNLFGTGTQFSGFFGGSYGQLAFSAPSLRGTRWQLAGRAFAIATSYNDRAFEHGREQYALDIRQRPAQAAIWLLRPLSSRTALRFEYDWDYNAFDRHEVTDPDFVIPRNQNAHTIRVGLDAQRAGWQGSVWGSYGRRIGWREWGTAPQRAAYDSREATYQRFGASLLRSQAVSSRVTTRIEAAIMGGSDLDRFSRYAFGTFDNRLRGYPAALIRYDRGGVIRTAAAVSLMRVLRLDGFADSALVHDPGFGPGLRHYTGLGAALEAPAPFRTLIAIEWGYGLQGIDTSGRRGTHVVRLSGYKVF